MTAQTFIPKRAAMTRQQIWDFFFHKNKKDFYCYADSERYKTPLYTVNDIPDDMCQSFVDAEFELRDDYENAEDFLEARNDLVQRYHRAILLRGTVGVK